MPLGRFNLILAIILVNNLAYGQCIIPPSPAPYEEAQPDGSKITLYTKGSPFNHWQETADGYTVVKNQQDYYEYAVEMNGQLVRSGFQVRPSSARMSSFMPGGISPHLQPEADEAELQAFMAETAAAVSPLYSSRSRGKITSLNFLVCLVEYPDLRSRFTPAEFEEYFNGVGGEFPSVKEYYLEVSNGELDINFVLSDWVMAQNGFEYYGRQNGYERARELTREGINGAVAQGIDFTQFDANGDQIIDGLLMLHAGPGAEEGSRNQYIWSHRWSGINMRVSGIYIDSYAAVPETRNWHGRSNGMLGIGVTCHEIGHMLGLPDLYDTRTDGRGIGRWGLMAGGGWEGRENFPSHLCAWSKEQMGWVEVVDISNSRGSQQLLPVVDEYVVYRINTANSEEYFLLENKRKTAAGFESYMPGNGLAIWHIDKRKAKTLIEDPSNIVNAFGERGVDLEEADDSNVDISYYTSLFHLYRLNQHFNLDSQPNSNYANIDTPLGEYSGVRVENVRLEGDTIVFDYDRRLPGEGENCEDALVAIEGQNETLFDTTWYSFDMLFDGLAYITADASDAEFEVEVYQQCEGDLIASGKTNTTDPLQVQLPAMEAGDSFVIKWIDAKEGEEQAPLTWKLGVETGEVMIEDSLALVAYYNAMQGADWSEDQKENWLTSPVYAWSGVTVRNNRVTGVDLPAPSGTVPEAFFDLTALEALRLTSGGEDEATALFPGGIDKLTQLEVIDISHEQMELNFLDQITSLGSLKEVRITAQAINHPLPEDVNNLSELRVLSIICPNWSTQLPSSLIELRYLQELAVVSDQLSGALPDISNLESLVLLRIEGPVSGSLPEGIANLTRLEELTISRAALTGPLVAGVFDLPRLRYLDLSYNQLESVPENFLQSPTVSAYYLNHNNIQGTLPAEVNFPDEYISLDISHNQFSGTLPDWVAGTSWSSFNVGYNQLEGTIPQVTDDPLVSLINLEYNRFTAMVAYDFGEEFIPPEFAVMCAGNQLSFDDLVPNAEILDNNDGAYEAFLPQDTVHQNMSTSVAFGSTYRIELRRDSALQDVVYYWFNDGEPTDTTAANFLEIENFMPSDTGRYRVEAVYRPEGGSLFDSLTLYYDEIELQAEGKLDQQITYVVPTNVSYGDDPFRLQASAPAEGALEFSVVEGQNQVILEEGEVTIVGAGDVKIRAFHPGDDLYNSTDTMIAFTIERAEQTISFAAIDDKTFGDDDFTLDVEASSGLPVDLVVEEEQPKVEIEGRTVSIIGAGEVTITARQDGNDNYYPASAVTVGFSIEKQDQLITFASIEDRTFGDPDIVFNVESNRGLPVTITTLTDNIELVDGKLKILAAGTAEVEASQPGTDNYQAAESVQRTFLIDKRSQLIYLDSISDKTLEEGAFEVMANSDVDLEVSLTAVKGDDLVNIKRKDEKFTITPLAVGNVVLQATQPGDENHYAAEPVQEDFYIYDEIVEKQYQFITLAEVPQTLEVGDELTLRAQVSSGLPVEFSVDGPAQLIRDSIVQVTGPGIIIIRVSQDGDEEYYPADIVERRITVLKGTQQITFEPIPDTVSLGQTIELEAVSSRNNTVLFRVLSGPANIEDNVASFFGEGEVSIEAYVLGDDLYEPNQVTQIFYVKKGLAPLGGKTQTIDYPQIADNQLSYGDGPVDFPVSSSGSLPVTVEISGADYADGQLVITQPGLVILTLSQAGNDEYKAVEVTVSFMVSKGVQTIEFTSDHIELLNDSTYLLKAIASSELPVQYRIVEGEARIDGNQLVAQVSGNVRVEAYQEGNDFYLPTAGYFQTITVDLITSLGGEQPNDWLLYPNPVRHRLKLILPQSAHHVKYQLLNQHGQQVATGVVDGEELDVREFPKGTYLLGVYLQNRWAFKKVVKID